MASLILLSAAGVFVGATALDNGFIRPPMGWSALYGAPFNQVNETIVTMAAQGLKDGGLTEFGYKYINLDDWYATRDPVTGEIMADKTKFPSGMAAVSDSVHASGCLFGVYSAASQRTCGNWSSSQFLEKKDANVFANVWKIDYLKYDSCLYNNGVASRARYTAMARALNLTGRKIYYSVEGWNPGQGSWGPELANQWRTGNDIWPRWDECILHNLYSNNIAAPYQHPGAFNDPDMIQPPVEIPGSTDKTGLTFDEATSQFVLWSVMKAPLVLGVNWAQLKTLKSAFPKYFGLITNQEIIDINQDISPQGILVGQMPSAKQTAKGSDPIEVTLQECNQLRTDQKFAVLNGSRIQLQGSELCFSLNETNIIVAEACDSSQQSQEFTGLSMVSEHNLWYPQNVSRCISAANGATRLSSQTCMYKGPLPPPFDGEIGSQLYVWDSFTGSIVTGGGGMCLTAGLPNIDITNKWVTNNGTLEHEVWMGVLSNNKKVVVLFNKGVNTETLTATRDVLQVPAEAAIPLRDVLARANLPDLAPLKDLTAVVPSHGVKLFMLG